MLNSHSNCDSMLNISGNYRGYQESQGINCKHDTNKNSQDGRVNTKRHKSCDEQFTTNRHKSCDEHFTTNRHKLLPLVMVFMVLQLMACCTAIVSTSKFTTFPCPKPCTCVPLDQERYAFFVNCSHQNITQLPDFNYELYGDRIQFL